MGIEALQRSEGHVRGHFRIGPQLFEVVMVDDLRGDPEEGEKTGADLLGWFRLAQEQLVLQSGLPHDTTEITFLHEVVHGWLQVSPTTFTDDQKELICDLISTQLYTAIWQNGDYFEQLIDHFRGEGSER